MLNHFDLTREEQLRIVWLYRDIKILKMNMATMNEIITARGHAEAEEVERAIHAKERIRFKKRAMADIVIAHIEKLPGG